MSVDPQTQGDGRHVPLSAYAEQGVVLVAKSNGEVVAVSLADLGFTVDTDEDGNLTVVGSGGGVDATGVTDGLVLMAEGEEAVWDHAGYAPYSPNTPAHFPGVAPGGHTLANALDSVGAVAAAIGELVDVTFGGTRTFSSGAFTASGNAGLTLASLNLATGNSGANNNSLTGNWATTDGSSVTLLAGVYMIRFQASIPEWTSPSADPSLYADISPSGGYLIRTSPDKGEPAGDGTSNTITVATFVFSNAATRTLTFQASLREAEGAGSPAGSGFVNAGATIIKIG